jgi:hypothetical protein
MRARHQQENDNFTYTQAIKRQHAEAERQRRTVAAREHLPSTPQPAPPPRPDLHRGDSVDPPEVRSFLKDGPNASDRFNRAADGAETPDDSIQWEMDEQARRRRRDRDRDFGR